MTLCFILKSSANFLWKFEFFSLFPPPPPAGLVSQIFFPTPPGSTGKSSHFKVVFLNRRTLSTRIKTAKATESQWLARNKRFRLAGTTFWANRSGMTAAPRSTLISKLSTKTWNASIKRFTSIHWKRSSTEPANSSWILDAFCSLFLSPISLLLQHQIQIHIKWP